MVYCLDNFALLEKRGELGCVQLQERGRNTSPELQFVRTDIIAFALGETVDEHGNLLCPEGHQRPITTATALAFPGDALFDEAAAEIGVDKAAMCATSGFAKARIIDAFTSGKARELFRLENFSTTAHHSNRYPTLGDSSRDAVVDREFLLLPQISACSRSNRHTSSNPISRFISAKG
jgi:hypothetical protein